MTKYTYRVVTNNGLGIYGPDHRSLGKAREAAGKVAASWSLPGTLFEVERVEHLGHDGHTHRYYLRRRKRWVTYPCPDATTRQPDFSVVS